jgi:hypothetical protein
MRNAIFHVAGFTSQTNFSVLSTQQESTEHNIVKVSHLSEKMWSVLARICRSVRSNLDGC